MCTLQFILRICSRQRCTFLIFFFSRTARGKRRFLIENKIHCPLNGVCMSNLLCNFTTLYCYTVYYVEVALSFRGLREDRVLIRYAVDLVSLSSLYLCFFSLFSCLSSLSSLLFSSRVSRIQCARAYSLAFLTVEITIITSRIRDKRRR